MAVLDLDTRLFGTQLIKAAEESLGLAQQQRQLLLAKENTHSDLTGWYDFPQLKGFALLEDIDNLKDRIDVSYDSVVVIGIGGSYLGARAVYQAFNHSYDLGKGAPQLYFAGEGIDQQTYLELLEHLEQRQPIINVISKSGTTTEPGIGFRIIYNYLVRRYGPKTARRRVVVTTDAEAGALRQLATENDFPCLTIPRDVGGRYSVLTAVGLLPLALTGFPVLEFLEGADQCFKEVKETDGSQHPALWYSSCRYAAWQHNKAIEVLAFSTHKLHFFGEWWKQLFAESEGKDGRGIFPTSACYTTDLHSLGQFFQQGPRSLFETFLQFQTPYYDINHGNKQTELSVPTGHAADGLRYLEGVALQDINRQAMLATKLAHFEGGVPVLTIDLPKHNPSNLGYLIAFMLISCGLSGAMLGVNPYDQPGVEAYKENMFALLAKPGFETRKQELTKKLLELNLMD